jgi:serine/threonine protein kinase
MELTELEVMYMSVQMAGGLAHLHLIGIAHRDFKPDNVLIFKVETHNEHSLYSAKIADFGLACACATCGDAPVQVCRRDGAAERPHTLPADWCGRALHLASGSRTFDRRTGSSACGLRTSTRPPGAAQPCGVRR